MKKTLSTQSLSISRRPSLTKIINENKQHNIQQKPILIQQKHILKPSRIPSPIPKSIPIHISELKNKHQQKQKLTHKQSKNDIKQIYEYKIKQRALKSKQSLQTSKQLINTMQHNNINMNKQVNNNNKNRQFQQQHKQQRNDFYNKQQQQQDAKYVINSLKLQNQKMSKQLCDLFKQNKQLKSLISNRNINNNNNNNSSINNTQAHSQSNKLNYNNGKIIKNQKHINNDPFINNKNYKKQMLNKLNDRHKLKTEISTTSFNQLNSYHNSQHIIKNDLIQSIYSKPKLNNSKNKSKSKSRNSITMNLNMSFVKIKSPSTGKNSEFRQNSKEMIDKMIRSNSNKNLKSYKQQHHKSSQLVNSQQPQNIKTIFSQFTSKKSILPQDLQEFYLLNKKIFGQFNQFITCSKQTFTQMLNKINISECYDSKKLQDSKYTVKMNTKMKKTLDKIQQLYKINQSKSVDVQFDYVQQNNSGKKYNVSEIQHNSNQQTPSSSVISFNEVNNNPQREKSYEKYRLKKLNENLGLIANFENKKLRTQITQPDSNEAKVYFSKPISTHVSRKISFNNSFNNSLKNSKMQ